MTIEGKHSLFEVLVQPIRLRALLYIADEGTASPRQIADALVESLGLTAYHVRVLERHGLIELDHETRHRGAIAHHYRVRRDLFDVLVPALARVEQAILAVEQARDVAPLVGVEESAA